jgi:hypothetical protein
MMSDTDVKPFGQYAGLTYDELVNEQPRYVQRLLAQEWLDAAVAAKLRAALAEYRADCAEQNGLQD